MIKQIEKETANMNTKKNKKSLYIGIAVLSLIILCFVGVRIYLHENASRNEALREYALSHGPWAEQSAWVSDDGQAYLLSQNQSGGHFADVTAYFYFDEAWHHFQVDMTYGNILSFSDIEARTDQFTADFSMKDATLTLSNLKSAEGGGTMPAEKNYVFSKAANYDETISQLPFALLA